MKAILHDPDLRLGDAPEPGLREGALLIRVLVSAITGADKDVDAERVDFGGIPGTCFVGVVEDVRGRQGRELVGRRVVARRVIGCGACEICRTGAEYRCRDRIWPGEWGADGSHAERLVLPAHGVLRVPDTITDEAAAMAPIVATIYSAISRGEMPNWSNVLVVGDGAMGLLVALCLASAGYTVTLRGKHGDRFDLLRRYGIHFNLATDEEEIAGSRPGRFGPALSNYPFVFEASGHETGWAAAARLVSPGGSVFVLSSCADGAPRGLTHVQDKNVRVVGLREGPLEPILRILAANLFDPTEVVSAIYDFDDAVLAYERSRSRRDRLALLRIGHLD